jgi:hypothetical protein
LGQKNDENVLNLVEKLLFSQIWLLTRYKVLKKEGSFYILDYLLGAYQANLANLEIVFI